MCGASLILAGHVFSLCLCLSLKGHMWRTLRAYGTGLSDGSKTAFASRYQTFVFNHCPGEHAGSSGFRGVIFQLGQADLVPLPSLFLLPEPAIGQRQGECRVTDRLRVG